MANPTQAQLVRVQKDNQKRACPMTESPLPWGDSPLHYSIDREKDGTLVIPRSELCVAIAPRLFNQGDLVVNDRTRFRVWLNWEGIKNKFPLSFGPWGSEMEEDLAKQLFPHIEPSSWGGSRWSFPMASTALRFWDMLVKITIADGEASWLGENDLHPAATMILAGLGDNQLSPSDRSSKAYLFNCAITSAFKGFSEPKNMVREEFRYFVMFFNENEHWVLGIFDRGAHKIWLADSAFKKVATKGADQRKKRLTKYESSLCETAIKAVNAVCNYDGCPNPVRRTPPEVEWLAGEKQEGDWECGWRCLLALSSFFRHSNHRRIGPLHTATEYNDPGNVPWFSYCDGNRAVPGEENCAMMKRLFHDWLCDSLGIDRNVEVLIKGLVQQRNLVQFISDSISRSPGGDVIMSSPPNPRSTNSKSATVANPSNVAKQEGPKSDHTKRSRPADTQRVSESGPVNRKLFPPAASRTADGAVTKHGPQVLRGEDPVRTGASTPGNSRSFAFTTPTSIPLGENPTRNPASRRRESLITTGRLTTPMQPIPSIETVMTSMAMTDAPSRGFTPRARSPTPAQMSRAESIVSLIDAASERLYLNRKINDPRARSWTREQDEVWEKKSQETALEMFAKSVKLEEMEIAGLTEQGVRPTPQALGRAVSRFRDIQGTPPPHRPEVNYFDDSQRFSATPGSRGSEKPGSRATPCPDQGSSKRDPTKFLSPNPNRGISETQPRPSPGPIEGTRGEKVEKPGNGKGLMLPPPKPVSAADIKLEAYVSLPKDNKRNGDMWNHDLFRGNRHGFLSSTVGFEGWGTGTEIGREFARYEEAWTEASRKPNALSREARLQRRNHPSGDQ